MTKDLGDKVKEGVFWAAFFSVLGFFIRMGAHVVIVRLLLPEEFGLMGVALILVQFSRRVSDLGFSQALIQMKKPRPDHFDTVFFVNVIVGLIIFVILFLFSPYFAGFFNDARLTPIFKVVAIDFILRSLGGMPKTILMRQMKFKELGMANLVSNSVQLISPIAFALSGFGVWSLVWGNLLGSATLILYLYSHAKWYPRLRFSPSTIKEFFAFGVWTSVSKYLMFCINNSDKFLIAKLLGVEQLGFYERALNLLNIPRVQVTKSLNRVMFPAYSKIQHDDVRTG